MMKKIVKFILVAMLFAGGTILNSCSKDNGGNEPVNPGGGGETPSLVGIKKITQIFWDATSDGNGGVVKQAKKEIRVTLFDLKGNPTEEREYDISGQKEELSGKMTYTYNEKDSLVSSFMYEIIDGKEIKEIEVCKVYDTQGRPIELKNIFYSDFEEIENIHTSTYNENNKLAETKFYNSNGDLKGVWRYTYGKDFKEIKYYDENNIYEGKQTETFNAGGKPLVVTLFDKDDKEISVTKREYNDKNDEIDFSITASTGTLRTQFKYKYNDHNHWIEKISTTTGGGHLDRVNITEREFEYY